MRQAAGLIDMAERALIDDLPSDPAKRVALAALASFSSIGYHATSTRHIAQTAGVSAGAPYSHFESKEDILNYWMLRGHRSALRVAREAIATGTSAQERVGLLVHGLTVWHCRYATLSQVVTSNLSALTPQHYAVIRELRHETEQCLRIPIEQGIATDTFRPVTIGTVMNAIFAMIVDVSRWFPAHQDEGAEAVAHEYAELVKAMLRPPALHQPDVGRPAGDTE